MARLFSDPERQPIGWAGFVGTWELRRTIRDHLAGQTNVAKGTATFTALTNHLRYDEQAVLTMGDGPSITTTRRYLWAEMNDGIRVLFEDGRPFHVIRTDAEAKAKDRHTCDPDIYDVIYDFARWPTWQCRWSVTGPRKRYDMKTSYVRSG